MSIKYLLLVTSEFENEITADHDHDYCITTQEFNKLISENFVVILKQADLASKNYIANFVKKTDFDNQLKILHQIKIN